MRKQRALNLLYDVRESQLLNRNYITNPDSWEYEDFITVYHKKLAKHKGDAELVWCNTVNEAIEEIENIKAVNGFALDISDEWYD